MDEYTVMGIITVVAIPIIISILAVWLQARKDNKDEHREYIKATTELTATIVKLTDKIDRLVCDNEKQDSRLDNLEQRTSELEHDVTIMQKDIEHYHNKKG